MSGDVNLSVAWTLGKLYDVLDSQIRDCQLQPSYNQGVQLPR